MSDILREIVSRLKTDLVETKKHTPRFVLEKQIAGMSPPRNFAEAAGPSQAIPGAAPAIIAEIKKASPSRGIIRGKFSPIELALELEKSGAAALSVLTEPHRFLGDIEYLRQIAAAVKIPLLRKDFIFDEYQIYEARAAGASAILLIAAMLDDSALSALAGTAHALGMSVLGEAHDAVELKRLLDSPADLIGINARNLKTFKTDLNITAELLGKIPPARRPVAESAIKTRDEIQKLRAAGTAGFLIGETLMRAESPGEKLKELLS